MNLTSPVKRATIFNRDMEASLALYRDILGFDVVEDKRVDGPAIANMIGLKNCSMRIVHLNAHGSEDGLIGLYCVLDADPPLDTVAPAKDNVVAYGQTAIVVHTDQPAKLYEALQGKYRFVREPLVYIKESDGDYIKAGRYTEMIFRDADGVLVSVIGHEPLES